MLRQTLRIVTIVLLFSAGLCVIAGVGLVAGCPGTSAGGGGNGAPGPLQEPAANLAGSWTVRSAESSTCQTSGDTATEEWEVTQTGNDLRAERDQGGVRTSLTGTISGSRVTLNGSNPVAGGTNTVKRADITVADDGDFFSGTLSWTWSSDVDRCSGSTSVTATRL